MAKRVKINVSDQTASDLIQVLEAKRQELLYDFRASGDGKERGELRVKYYRIAKTIRQLQDGLLDAGWDVGGYIEEFKPADFGG